MKLPWTKNPWPQCKHGWDPRYHGNCACPFCVEEEERMEVIYQQQQKALEERARTLGLRNVPNREAKP